MTVEQRIFRVTKTDEGYIRRNETARKRHRVIESLYSHSQEISVIESVYSHTKRQGNAVE